jgi:hypothetical protein
VLTGAVVDNADDGLTVDDAIFTEDTGKGAATTDGVVVDDDSLLIDRSGGLFIIALTPDDAGAVACAADAIVVDIADDDTMDGKAPKVNND